MKTLLLALALLAPGVARADEASEARSQAAWQEARMLSDQKRFAEALVAIDRGLAADAKNFDLLWLKAGVTGWSGRHAEAAALYRRLMGERPERARDLRTDFAGELAEAGRLDEARAEFARAAAEDSSNTQARLGHARTLNWAGRHREAARAYRKLLAAGVDDPEVYDGLAHAEYWSGRSDRARSTLASLLERQGSHPEAAALEAALRRESRQTLTTTYEGSSDSDDLTLGTWSAEYRAPIGTRDVWMLTWRGDRLEDADGSYDLGRAGAGHFRIWSDVLETHAYASWQYRGPGDDHRFLGDGWATLRPTDALRLDLGLGREHVASRRALDFNMLYWTGSASLDWQATPRWSAHASHRENFYSDRNRSWLSGSEFDYQFAARRNASWTAGMEFQHLAAESDPDHGYYAPRSYVEIGPRVAVSAEPAAGWSVDGAVRAGREREAGALWNTYYGLEGSLLAPLGRSASLALTAARTDSHLGSADGFERTAGSVSLIVRF